MKTENSILLVEDDIPLATSISEYLMNEGFSVEIESNGLNAIDRIIMLQPDLVILDIMLPGKDGVSICREVRPNYDGFILMFTAKEDDIDQIVGLEVGADDYLIKPIKPRLMLAKVNSFLRRKSQHIKNSAEFETKSFGGLSIDFTAREVIHNEVKLSLTSAEYELLALLIKHAGSILSRDDIARNTTGNVYDGFERTIDNKVSSLRKKLNDNAKEPSKIKTVRSKGYVLVSTAF